MKNKILISIIVFFAVFHFADAQSLYLTSPKSSYNVGDTFLVSLYINTKNTAINTISGAIRVPADKLRITETRYGNSIITLWVERPNVNSSAGTITFAGGVPGGFNGSSGPILSFVARALNTGSVSIGLSDMKVLLNDGLGTALNSVSPGTLNVSILKTPAAVPKKEEPKEEVYVPLADEVSPESFMPMVSRHPSIAENDYFVSFFAVDKDSGLARYEAKEKPFILSYFTSRFDTPWAITESPYVISRQYLTREVLVRAYDQLGNFTEETVLKPLHPAVILVFAAFWTLIVAAASYFYFKPRQVRKIKIKRKK